MDWVHLNYLDTEFKRVLELTLKPHYLYIIKQCLEALPNTDKLNFIRVHSLLEQNINPPKLKYKQREDVLGITKKKTKPAHLPNRKSNENGDQNNLAIEEGQKQWLKKLMLPKYFLAFLLWEKKLKDIKNKKGYFEALKSVINLAFGVKEKDQGSPSRDTRKMLDRQSEAKNKEQQDPISKLKLDIKELLESQIINDKPKDIQDPLNQIGNVHEVKQWKSNYQSSFCCVKMDHALLEGLKPAGKSINLDHTNL